MISVGQLADWIIANRKGDAFKQFSWEEIVITINESIEQNALICAVDNDSIFGVCCGELDTERRVYHAANIITVTPRAMVAMIHRFKELFPKYEVRVKRKGKDRIIKSTEHTLERLTRQQLRK